MVGTPAPEFDLPAQHGQSRASLGDARGKVVIVDFWATWCEPCRMSFPKYEALAGKYGDRVMVVGISEDDEPDGIASFAKETGATFTLAWDGDKSVASSYKPEAMPTSFIIDQQGLVCFVHEGFHKGDERAIQQDVEKLLKD
jgi:peroxiredoxin